VVTLPGHRQPTPFLRLRCTGVSDDGVIGIYKATREQYSENEFPWSYGPLTGTPEQPRQPCETSTGRETSVRTFLH